MSEISDTELLMRLIENEGSNALKQVASDYVTSCEPSHTIGADDDTKLSCPGCGQLCDFSTCWCGGSREDHLDGAYADHGFVPMGCDCPDIKPLPRPPEPEPPPPVIEDLHEWDLFNCVPLPEPTRGYSNLTCQWCGITEVVRDKREPKGAWFAKHHLGKCTSASYL